MHSPKIHLRGTCEIICGQKTQKLRFRVMLYMHESISSEKQVKQQLLTVLVLLSQG